MKRFDTEQWQSLEMAIEAFIPRLLSTASIWIPIVGLTCLLVTYISSWIQSFPGKPGVGNEPPMLPHWLPHLGHIFQYLNNPGKLLRTASKQYPTIPFSLLLPGAKFHVITSPSTAFYIFTRPRDFISEPVVASMMENALELEGKDLEKFNVPISHLRKSPEFTPGQQESFAFVGRNHALYLKHLSGKGLDPIVQVYKRQLLSCVKEVFPLGEEQASVQLDMHKTLRKLIFDASSVTFFGTRVFDMAPELWDYWRAFDDAAYIGVRSSASFYLRPWTLPGRRRLLETFDGWVETDLEEWDDDAGVWTEKWGVKLNWQRERMARDHNVTTRGRACVHVSFLWVIITNTAPMLTWTMNAILNHDDVLDEFRRIADGHLAHGLEAFDVSHFVQEPFIQALWKEILRLGVTSNAARVVSRDTELDGYVVRKGSVILVPSKVLHFDPTVFTNPDRFNPWRWLYAEPDSAGDLGTKRTPISEEQLKRQNLNLRPFGGGTGVCSGRFVAEKEIMMAAAVLLHWFDWEFDAEQDRPWPNLNPRGLAAMEPLVDPRMTVRKRKPFVA